MRAGDATIPTVVGPRPVPTWPAELFVAIERLPVAAYTWDDENPAVVWDAAGAPAPYVWDDPSIVASSMLDATCDVRGVDLEHGAPDSAGRFQASTVTLTLDNAAGQWSRYDSSGRLVYFAPGRNVQLWTRYNGAAWWLFSGVVTRWDELPDASVEIEAWDALSVLNQGIGEWVPGTFGQRPGDRLAAIVALIAYTGRTRFATGDNALHAFTSTATPLEEMQAVALSDGGVIAVDVDGTLVYSDRTWPLGRTDQPAVPVLTDNICTGPVVVWDLQLATDDELANVVQLTNLEGLTVSATSADSIALYRRQTLEHSNDQWTTTTEGNALAAALLDRQRSAPARVESFTLYLHDPRLDLWSVGLDLRRGDRLRLVRDQVAVAGPELVDVNLVCWSTHHRITPDAWVLEVGTTRAVSANEWWRWDQSGIAWDDPTDPPLWTF